MESHEVSVFSQRPDSLPAQTSQLERTRVVFCVFGWWVFFVFRSLPFIQTHRTVKSTYWPTLVKTQWTKAVQNRGEQGRAPIHLQSSAFLWRTFSSSLTMFLLPFVVGQTRRADQHVRPHFDDVDWSWIVAKLCSRSLFRTKSLYKTLTRSTNRTTYRGPTQNSTHLLHRLLSSSSANETEEQEEEAWLQASSHAVKVCLH